MTNIGIGTTFVLQILANIQRHDCEIYKQSI